MLLSAPFTLDEQERIAALHALHILDTPPEEQFDHIVQLARYIFRVPIPHQFQQQKLDLLHDLAQVVEREINPTHTQIPTLLFDDATIRMLLLEAR